MTTTPSPPDWRGLCEELAEELERAGRGFRITDAAPETLFAWSDEAFRAAARARAALAQPEPEVVGPSLNQLSDWITKCTQNPKENRWTRHVDHHDALAIAKAALYDWGRPAPAPAGERQAAPVPVAWMHRGEPDFDGKKWRDNWRVTLDQRLAEFEAKPDNPIPLFRAQPAPVPVAVSERLPQPEDCDAEGFIWLWDCERRWVRQCRAAASSNTWTGAHWLPGWFLPLPSGEVGA